MEFVNAIAKARFGTARPQHIQLHKGDGLVVELLCMESGQETTITSGQWVYYVVTGTASLTSDGQTSDVPAGQVATTAPNETHTITNGSEGRLVVLATGRVG